MAKVDLKDRLNAKKRVQPVASTDDLLMGDDALVNNDKINNNDNNDIEDRISDNLIPFATRLPESLILRLKQHQYWDREIIMDTVIKALNNYLDEFPDSNKSLPNGVLEKLSNKGRKKKK